jgi:hypothetical protein
MVLDGWKWSERFGEGDYDYEYEYEGKKGGGGGTGYVLPVNPLGPR